MKGKKHPPKQKDTKGLRQTPWDYLVSKEQKKYEDSWKKNAVEIGTNPISILYNHIK